jgi:type IV secretory pathway VirB3-like protein
MQRFESPVLSAVAYPPLILFAPVKAAGANLVINVMLYLFCSAVLSFPPPWFWFITAVIGHGCLIWWNSKDPHFITLNESRMQRGKKLPTRLSAPTKNLVKAEGRKYVP